MRRLIRIPIVHTSVDLGSLAESVRTYYLDTFGSETWSQRERTVAKLWSAIQDKVRALDIDYRKVRVYQDGLPVCGFEREIARELAQAGSSNHQLILELLGRGAALMGTEDPQLLIQEYETQRHAAAEGVRPQQDRAAQSARLLEARDRFIAQRIDETLRPGETGLLFLGAAHRLDMGDRADIQVETLEPWPA